MSSREGFSPRSRTWIKNSCATSVNTIKNPKPLNGSTSIQPVEALAIQLLQLTTYHTQEYGSGHRIAHSMAKICMQSESGHRTPKLPVKYPISVRAAALEPRDGREPDRSDTKHDQNKYSRNHTSRQQTRR